MVVGAAGGFSCFASAGEMEAHPTEKTVERATMQRVPIVLNEFSGNGMAILPVPASRDASL